VVKKWIPKKCALKILSNILQTLFLLAKCYDEQYLEHDFPLLFKLNARLNLYSVGLIAASATTST
jgi:hypothetical protein